MIYRILEFANTTIAIPHECDSVKNTPQTQTDTANIDGSHSTLLADKKEVEEFIYFLRGQAYLTKDKSTSFLKDIFNL